MNKILSMKFLGWGDKIQSNSKVPEITTTEACKSLEPPKKVASHSSYLQDIMSMKHDEKATYNTVSFLLKTLSPTLSEELPTWVTYNSLLGKRLFRTAPIMLPVMVVQLIRIICTQHRTRLRNYESRFTEMEKRSLHSIYSCISRLHGCRKRLIPKEVLCFMFRILSSILFTVCLK